MMALKQKEKSYRQYGIVGKTQDLELKDQGLSPSSASLLVIKTLNNSFSLFISRFLHLQMAIPPIPRIVVSTE